ncbi:MAG: NAD(P)H-dependent oxidoreductase [Methanobacterium sp.]
MEFENILKERYATKKFDGKKIDEDKIKQIKEMIRLSPSAINLQPWKIKIISDESIKEKLSPATMDQPQIESCSHLLVFCADTDLEERANKLLDSLKASNVPEENLQFLESVLNNFLSSLSDEKGVCEVQHNVFIAATTAIYAAKSLGIDSCPMKGFNPAAYSEILELPDNLVPTIIVPLGYAADTPMPKTRLLAEEIFF